MTADETWMELKLLISKAKKPDSILLKSKVHSYLCSQDGPVRLLRTFEASEKIPGETRLLREICLALNLKSSNLINLTGPERTRLLKALAISSKPYATSDSFFWDYLWLIIRDGDRGTTKDMLLVAALALAKMNKSCTSPLQLSTKIHALTGGTILPQERWAEVVGKTREVVVDVDFSNRLKAVVGIFTAGFVPASVPPPPYVPPVKAEPSLPIVSIAVASGEVSELVPATDGTLLLPVQPNTTEAHEATPVAPTPLEQEETPVESVNVAVVPITATPPEAITVVPKKEKAKPKEAVPTPEPPRALDPELAVLLKEIIAAVRSVAGPQEQIGALTKEVAALGKRMDAHDHRVADSQRMEDEVGELRTRIQEQQSELNAARRERDAAVGREKELARLVADTDDRIDKTNARAERNIHGAQRERDAALQTFKAGLWDAVQADLADVTDASPDEEFGSVEEKVIMTRLRNIRDALRHEGITP